MDDVKKVIKLLKKCLQEKRCVSMPSVSSFESPPPNKTDPSVVVYRSRWLKLQASRFRRRFPEVPDHEKLVNYFSCALVSDILLQGHLFITKNYFGFYSNIFGHKTQILIPVSDVVKVTKEKIAKIIPNAVGVYTDSEKFIFGSLLSRDTAFRVIQQIWIQSTDPGLGLPDDSDSEISPAVALFADEESSMSSGASGNMASEEVPTTSEMATTPEVVSPIKTALLTSPFPKKRTTTTAAPLLKSSAILSKCSLNFAKGYLIKIDELVKELSRVSRTSLLFMVSTFLLVILFISTTVLLYRIHLLHQKLLIKDDFYADNIPRFEAVSELVPTDFTNVVKSLEDRIQSLAEVRTTLEKLVAKANVREVPSTPISQYGT
ncbi:GRAM domain-containing protein 2B isoform X2 [Parasteatoda tepidariorum]|uniref:GRAM domain-containing protein 2B isoform X2 n=1 Tax=Parasteatoda tepidariorum TaxID=114398 RepID=UPI00077FC021|nr:GRAM domain-containing protein 2B isoform X2 [Parasteatoda tepidariorum]